MVVIDILGTLLVVALFVFAVGALWIGLLAAIGAVRLVQCERCGHLGLTPTHHPLRQCARCRHGNLLHPVATLRHHEVPPVTR